MTDRKGWWQRLREEQVSVTWAVTDRNLGAAWADQAELGIPVPAAVAAAHAAWVQDQERAGGVPDRDRARILVTVRDARHAVGHAVLYPGRVHPLWAQAVERAVNSR